MVSGKKSTVNGFPSPRFGIEISLKVKKPLSCVTVLKSSNPDGLKASSSFMDVFLVFPLTSLKLPILKETVSVGSFKSIVIGIEMTPFSSEFRVLDEELLLTSIPTGSAFADIEIVIVLKDDLVAVDIPLSKEDAITFRLKSDLTSPPVTIPKLVNCEFVKAIASSSPEPKSNEAEVPTSSLVVVFTNLLTCDGFST